MITEAIATWFLNAVAWLVDLLPSPTAEMVSSGQSFTGRIDQVINQVANLSPVVPFEGIAVAAGVLFAFMAFAIVLQVSRIVLSFVTLGGGGL